MRAAPPLQVTVVRFGVWRAALGALIAAGAATTGAWLLTAGDRPFATSLCVGAVSLIALTVAASAIRVPAYRLRWDGTRWHVAAAPSPAPATATSGAVDDEPWSGRVGVAVDFGAWLLLRFSADSGPPHCPHRWLPVQRRGLEGPWHALRATVYSARLAVAGPGDAVAAVGRGPAA